MDWQDNGFPEKGTLYCEVCNGKMSWDLRGPPVVRPKVYSSEWDTERPRLIALCSKKCDTAWRRRGG